MIPKSGSATSAPEPENKGERMTKSDRQAADYRAEASERAAPARVTTQRVTLELPPTPEPRGWLTEEERKFLEQMRDDSAKASMGTGSAGHEAHKKRTYELLRALLARSSPPEVVLVKELDWYDDSGDHVSGYDREKVHAALAAAGVAVKEVGNG
jgi:hypothetical protein